TMRPTSDTMIVRLPPILSSTSPIAIADDPAATLVTMLNASTSSIVRPNEPAAETPPNAYTALSPSLYTSRAVGNRTVLRLRAPALNVCLSCVQPSRMTRPGGDARDLSSRTQRNSGTLNTTNHTATSRFVARTFSPFSLEKPNQGDSGCTSMTSASPSARSPP